MTATPASATPIVTHVRSATRSPSRTKPSNPATNGPVDMSRSVFATDVCAREKMKQVDATDMHTATAKTGRPPSRHSATMLRRWRNDNTSARKTDAKTLRQKLVVHGVVATSRAISAPLLQQMAAQATRRTPRRVAGAEDVGVSGGSRRDAGRATSG